MRWKSSTYDVSSLSARFAKFWTVQAVEAFGYAWGAFWDRLSRVRGIWQNELRVQLSLKTPGLRGVCGDAMETQHFWWLFSQSHICLILNGSSSAGIWVRLRSVLRPAQWSTQKRCKAKMRSTLQVASKKILKQRRCQQQNNLSKKDDSNKDDSSEGDESNEDESKED